MKSIEELKSDRLSHVEANALEFKVAVERVFDLIKSNNLTGKRRVRLEVGQVAHTKWNYHVAELLKGMKFGVKRRVDKSGESITITW